MKKLFLSFILFLFLIFSFPATALSQTLSQALQTGTLTVDRVNYQSVYIHITNWISFGQPDQVNGSIGMSGFDGNVNLNFGAPIKTVLFSYVLYDGKLIKGADFTTGRFYYVDLNTGIKTLAYMVGRILQSGHGLFHYQIINVLDQTTVVVSASLDGQYAYYPLASGSTSINF